MIYTSIMAAACSILMSVATATPVTAPAKNTTAKSNNLYQPAPGNIVINNNCNYDIYIEESAADGSGEPENIMYPGGGWDYFQRGDGVPVWIRLSPTSWPPEDSIDQFKLRYDFDGNADVLTYILLFLSANPEWAVPVKLRTSDPNAQTITCTGTPPLCDHRGVQETSLGSDLYLDLC